MDEVVKGSFKTHLPNVLKAIEEADFIAIDTEFTGLALDASTKSTLSDDGKVRYEKHRKSVSNFTLLEVGIACFNEESRTPLSNQPRYRARNFNFVVYPNAGGVVDVRFSCQASSLHFNVVHDVDLNRFVRDGISYLNQGQIEDVRSILEERRWCEHMNAYNVDSAVKRVCAYVTEWWCDETDDLEEVRQLTFQKPPRPADSNSRVRKTSNETDKRTGDADGNTLELNAELLKQLGALECPLYILKNELQVRLCEALNVDIRIEHHSKSIVIDWLGPQTSEQSKAASAATRDQADLEEYLSEIRGFSLVFDKLVQCNKPLVGHNCLLDLLFFYDKFYRPLPADYEEFKCVFHQQLFAKVFDTKWIAFSVRKLIEDNYNDNGDGVPVHGKLYADLRAAADKNNAGSSNAVQRMRLHNFESLRGTSLGELFRGLSKQSAFNSPSCFVELTHNDAGTPTRSEAAVETTISEHAHRAAIDALMTGIVFLRMAHIATQEQLVAQLLKASSTDQEVTRLLDEQNFTFSHYVSTLDSFGLTNCLNLIYGAVRCVRLNTSDPIASPPTLLLAEARASGASKTLDVLDVTRRLLPFGAFELEMRDARSAKIAVGSTFTSRKLLDVYGSRSQSEASFRLSPYIALRSQNRIRTPVWLCVGLGLVGAGAFISYSFLKKSR